MLTVIDFLDSCLTGTTLPTPEQQLVSHWLFVMTVNWLINYNSHSSIFMQAMLDAGQDPSRLNLPAYAKRMSVSSQEHRMQPLLQHWKILLCLAWQSLFIDTPILAQIRDTEASPCYWWENSFRFSNKVHSCWWLHQSAFNHWVCLCDKIFA